MPPSSVTHCAARATTGRRSATVVGRAGVVEREAAHRPTVRTGGVVDPTCYCPGGPRPRRRAGRPGQLPGTSSFERRTPDADHGDVDVGERGSSRRSRQAGGSPTGVMPPYSMPDSATARSIDRNEHLRTSSSRLTSVVDVGAGVGADEAGGDALAPRRGVRRRRRSWRRCRAAGRRPRPSPRCRRCRDRSRRRHPVGPRPCRQGGGDGWGEEVGSVERRARLVIRPREGVVTPPWCRGPRAAPRSARPIRPAGTRPVGGRR